MTRPQTPAPRRVTGDEFKDVLTATREQAPVNWLADAEHLIHRTAATTLADATVAIAATALADESALPPPPLKAVADAQLAQPHQQPQPQQAVADAQLQQPPPRRPFAGGL